MAIRILRFTGVVSKFLKQLELRIIIIHIHAKFGSPSFCSSGDVAVHTDIFITFRQIINIFLPSIRL